jgi:aspartyl-tRNA(Asn)/glutamyl-tRNA(Gln) amidotransferase subunit A
MTPPDTLLEARKALDAGWITAVELLDGLLQVLAEREPSVRALVTTTVDLAREQAAKADFRLAAGERTPLLGIPVVVKDLIDVAGVPTTAGSKVLDGNVPTTSATVWSRLEAAGAVLVGKANTHEFAYGGTTAPTRNPADTRRIVGGSSGGPAAALAGGFCLGAVGTDTAGSIRIPANLCGVAGLKTTRGLVPVHGVLPLAPTLDVVGPMARSVADLEPLLRVIADLPEGTTWSGVPNTVGILRTGREEPSVSEAVAAASTALAGLGATIVEVLLPGFEASVGDDFTVIGFEATKIHRRWADKRDLYTPYVRDRLADAVGVTSDDNAAALVAARLLSVELDRVLDEVDVLLLAGVPFPAPPAYDERVFVAGEWEDRDTGLCRNTAFANLTGHPALALPAGLDDGLPVGVQLVGKHRSDLALIALGARLEPLLPAGLPAHLNSG